MTRSRVTGDSSAASHGPRAEALERRLLFAAGELDLQFSGDGRTTIDFGYNDVARDVVVDASGRIIAAGYDMGGSADFAVARFLAGGELDTTFNDVASPTLANGDGKLSFGFGGLSSERASGVALQSDGKIVVVGTTKPGPDDAADSGNDFAIARINADGTLDATFGGDGKVTIDFGGNDQCNDVVIQPDGKIVVVGSRLTLGPLEQDFAVARLNSDGTLDNTFSDDGMQNVDMLAGADDFANGVAMSGEKIIVAGASGLRGSGATAFNFAIARLNADGSLDSDFSGDGRQFVDFRGGEDIAEDVAVDRYGRVVLAGSGGATDTSGADFAVARLTAAGNLDAFFNDVDVPAAGNGDGRLLLDLGAFGSALGLAMEPNGADPEIYLAGYAGDPADGRDFVLARLQPEGSLDSSFGGGDGVQLTDFADSDDFGYAVALEKNGGAVVAGSSAANFAVARYFGELDGGFDVDGTQTINFGGNDTGRAVALQRNGAVIVAGDWDAGAADFAVARFTRAGAPDTTFGAGDGRINLTFGGGAFGGVERATAVGLQSDGKILVAGYTDAGTDGGADPFDIAVARLHPNGSIDTSFSGDGKVTVDFGHDDRASALLIQPDGKIVVVGQWDGGVSDFAVVRFNPDGSLDSTFSGDGRQNVFFGLTIGASVERATAVALGPGGRIIVVGYTDADPVRRNDFAVAQLTPAGELDTSFSDDGKMTIDFAGDDRATGVAVRPDGRVVVGGFSDDGASDFAVAQIRGSFLDNAFGRGTGKLELFTNEAAEFAHGLALTDDGKIIMVGESNSHAAAPGNFTVTRILADGSGADPAFNADGEHFLDFGRDDRAYAVAIQADDRRVVVVGASDGNFAVARYDAAPVVRQVYVSSSEWTPAFMEYLQAQGLGSVDFGYAVPAGGRQLDELPWINLNEISITFSDFVSTELNDLAIRGVNRAEYPLDPAPGGMTLYPGARTVKWRLAPEVFFGKDKLLLELADARTNQGAALDGDWENSEAGAYPSGDGAAGGDFRFRINVLSGDVDTSGTVLAADFSEVKRKFFSSTTNPGSGVGAYTVFHDVNGSGAILADDYSHVKRRFFDTLPGTDPGALCQT